MKIKFLTEGVLVFDKNMVIGDLHLGIENDLARKGISVPSQTKTIQKKITRLISKYKIKHLIFIGDVRHRLPLPSRQEERELPSFFRHFIKKVKVSVIKGNHDGRIEDLLPNAVNVYPASGFIIDNIYMSHGHNKPIPTAKECSTFIIGHTHPVIEFWSSGVRMTETVWIISHGCMELQGNAGTPIKVITMPAFNSLLGGVAVNSKKYKISGPILKNTDFKNSEIILLDGTYIGKLKDLEIKKK